MTRVQNQCFAFYLVAAGLFPVLAARAQYTVPGSYAAVDMSETSSSTYNVPNLTRGYTIDVTSPIQVSALGVFDSDGDPLATAHVVTIWNARGSTVATVTVPSGSGGTLINQFRYAPITPVDLSPGDYTVGVYYPNVTSGLGDALLTGITDITTDPSFTILSYEFAHPGYFDPAGDLADQSGTFGANFLMQEVPEPSALALAGVGAAVLWGFCRSKGA